MLHRFLPWLAPRPAPRRLQTPTVLSVHTTVLGKCRLATVPMLSTNSTVFALASGAGKCGVGVVRVSGPRAGAALEAVTRKRNGFVPRRATTAVLYDPESGHVVDHGLVIWFPGPASYTGEDVAELHVHGGRAVIDGTLRALSSVEDVEPAQPGEFTRRAFFNGKMDLTEVEAVSDLLNADTEAQRLLALQQLDGSLRRLYTTWRKEIIGCLAHAEAVIDFGEDEDDCNDAVYDAVEARLRLLAADMKAHLDDGRRGEIIRDGVKLVILGPPNAGKSSLLNLLANRAAAIVSDIPGTTRDVIELAFDLGGFPIQVCDTAGIRDSSDAIEQEGVVRAVSRAQEANIVLLVLDTMALAHDHNAADMLERCHAAVSSTDAQLVVLLNKSDLVSPGDVDVATRLVQSVIPDGVPLWHVSCATKDGLAVFMDGLQATVESMFDSGAGHGNSGVVLTRARHRHHLEACVEALDVFLANPGQVDIAAEELRIAANSVGVITGAVDVEELLDIVFADFCIGK